MTYIATITDDDAQAEQETFQAFATLHPREAYATDAERFLQFAMRVSGKSREAILRVIQEEEL